MTQRLPSRLRKQIEPLTRRRESLIEILHAVQEEEGCVSIASEMAIADLLGLSVAEVHGVVTFYHAFSTEPRGRHVIRLCEGTACHVGGSAQLLQVLEGHLGIQAGETTLDRSITLETVACLGACALSPVMVVNGKVYGRMNPKRIENILSQYCKKET